MNLPLRTILVLIALSAQAAPVKPLPDSMWLYRDTIPEYRYYTDIGLCDTSLTNTMCTMAGTDSGRLFESDTGDRYNGKYINFNYQLTGGYAGYKIFWDCSVLSWNATGYDTLVLMHKGPQPGHEVRLVWCRYSSDTRDFEWVEMGGFTSSSTWKREAIPFSEKFGVKDGLLQLRILVYDKNNPSDGSDIDGILKIDDIAFAHPCGFPTCSTHLVTPVLSEPPDFSTFSGPVLVPLSWGRSDSAAWYEVEVLRYSDTGGFTTILDSTLTATQLTIAISPAAPATLFNWRVRAGSRTDSSTWSVYRSFSVEATGANTRYRSFRTRSAATPIRMIDAQQCELELPPGSARSTLSVFSSTGRQLASQTVSGPGRRVIPLPDIPAGIHLIRLETETGTTVVRRLRCR